MNWLAVLKAIAPKGKDSILRGVAQAMPGIVAEFQINTPLRQAHFLAQLAHESDGFKTTVEYASGAAYEGRKDLGNTQPGDGKRFKGRGLIQLTGRANYGAAGEALGLDLVGSPALAAQFPAAIRSAGWYWSTRKLNIKADRDDVRAVTKAINGGYNGLSDRMAYLARAKSALAKADDLPTVPPKSMATSKTGAAAIASGVAAGIPAITEVVNATKSVVTSVNDAKETATSLFDVVQSVPLSAWLGIIVVGLCVFIWLDRRKKLVEHGV